ncbi:hypothetical protein SDRG_00987 [Saprolegnia diclina VS20]|uniref:Uncharacterized protein n=1 Tax=Saprolegnia diclina (strain VS20) TaxID=1156394 RepID=T0SGS8_SAPDV|nr:hypothetical protein SDRG_00987 [Saprolegnia diclina VS20]EQC42147.1 hypothetical protein SDRG_00987 [Saprolegnia diclina VS20]|eukprot:XP_008604716.1 hypothetical protein SDRG_00987 [Saprolegnia diclina VS20]
MKPSHAHYMRGWFTDPAMYPLLLIVPLPLALGAYCGFRYCVNCPEVRWRKETRHDPLFRSHEPSGASFYAHAHALARLKPNAITRVNDAHLQDKDK